MSAGMTRVQAIWQHPLYQKHLNALTRLESDRIFCRHTPEHFLDVARLAYIFALERNLDCFRELIYCTALSMILAVSNSTQTVHRTMKQVSPLQGRF